MTGVDVGEFANDDARVCFLGVRCGLVEAILRKRCPFDAAPSLSAMSMRLCARMAAGSDVAFLIASNGFTIDGSAV